MSVCLKLIDKRPPYTFTLLITEESFRAPNHNQSISGARKEHVEPLWGRHETDVSVLVTPGQARDYDFALLTLIVICE